MSALKKFFNMLEDKIYPQFKNYIRLKSTRVSICKAENNKCYIFFHNNGREILQDLDDKVYFSLSVWEDRHE